MGSCPAIRYGVPEGGAPEYNVNSGRELFRCGTQCTKLFIVNVSVEKSIINFGCMGIDDAGTEQFCLQSVNGTAREQAVVNWQGKDGASAALPNGYVINRAVACAGSEVVCTHVEGNLSIRAMINVEDLTVDVSEEMKNLALAKIGSCGEGSTQLDALEWVFSDMNTNVSPTDWQSASVTFQGFGPTDSACDRPKTTRANFNWQNGRYECSTGQIKYDDTPTPEYLATVIQTLLAAL